MQNFINSIRYKTPNILPDTFFFSKINYKVRRFLDLRGKKEHKLTQAYKQILDNGAKIPEDQGFIVLNFKDNEKFKKMHDYAKVLEEKINVNDYLKKSQKPFLLTIELDMMKDSHKDIKNFITSNEFLSPILSYLGVIPIISHVQYWYSPCNENIPTRSQLFHIDGIDYRQVKCFIPLDKINEDNGQTNLLSKSLTHKVHKKLYDRGIVNKRNMKVEDDVIYKFIEKNEVIKANLTPGDVLMADLCQCYHYGSRKGDKERKLLMVQFITPWARTLPLAQKKMYIQDKNQLENKIFSYYNYFSQKSKFII